MKIQIDTTNKTIKLEESIKFYDLIKALNDLFPNDTWKEYKLEITPIIHWQNPIIIKELTPIPNNPWINPGPVWCGPYITSNGDNIINLQYDYKS